MTFEMSLDRTVFKRAVYSISDLFAELGGLIALVRILCASLLYIITRYSVY